MKAPLRREISKSAAIGRKNKKKERGADGGSRCSSSSGWSQATRRLLCRGRRKSATQKSFRRSPTRPHLSQPKAESPASRAPRAAGRGTSETTLVLKKSRSPPIPRISSCKKPSGPILSSESNPIAWKSKVPSADAKNSRESPPRV